MSWQSAIALWMHKQRGAGFPHQLGIWEIVGNLGNSWEFDVDHSQPGIGLE